MENNSSLDPLGPQFGKINAPAINTQSMSPFEGDTPRDHKINFPVTPPLSSTNPNYPIQDAITGDSRGMQSKNNPRKKLSAKEMGNAIGDNFIMQDALHKDRNQYATVNAYNAGPSGNSFYKRYAAYGQKKFDEIGFSPLRDNEAMYNANTTVGDDFSRMMKNSFVPLFSRGFVAGPKSLIKMMQGDFSADTEDARAYENAAAIGQSSKKGMGAFFSNTAMSFGYTAGILTESVLEEVAGALLAPVTGGGSFFAATANNARKIGTTIDRAMDGYKAVNTTLKEANNINGARKMWKAAENIGKSKVGQFLNPLENTFDALVGVGKNADNLTGLARLAQGTGKTAGGLFRDIRNINMSLAEARLEGGMTQNAVYDKAYDAFYKRNGRAPSDDEQYQMTKTAKEAGVNTIIWNSALIFATNKIVLPNFLKSGISKKAVQSKIDDVYAFKGGKVVLEKTFGEGKKIATGKFNFVEDTFVNSLKGFKKAPIMTTAKLTGKYLKANLMEGVQESLQDVISVANEKYYLDAYKNKELGAHLYNRALSSIMYDGLKDQFSSQGFETFASGALMGLFSGGLNLVKGGLDYGYNKTFNKEKYQEYKDARAKHGTDVAKQLTALYNSPSEFFNSRIVNYGTQNNTITNIDDADTKEAKDDLSQAFMSQVYTALDTDTLNHFKDHIGSFKETSPEEFEEAFGFEKGTGAKEQQKIDKILTNIDAVEKSYKYANDRFPNPVDISNYKQGTPEFEDAAIFHQAWKSGVRDYVFNNNTFMNVVGRMTSISNTILNNPSMKKMSQLDMNLILDPTNIDNELDLLKSEIDSLKTSTDTKSKADLTKKEARVKALEEFADVHEKYLSRPQKLKLAEAIFDAVKEKKGFESLSDEEKIQVLEVNQKHFEEAFGERLNDDELQNILDAEKGNTLLNSKLEIAYKNYLKNSNGIDQSYVFNTDIDESFETLKHYYLLNAESKELVKAINLLHDPQSFMDNVNKTRTWMGNMYNNREDYFIDMVNKQMEALESNELLNKFADMNIFLDLEQFQDFMENGVPPKEFLDNTTKQVIPIGSDRYNELLFTLYEAKKLREKNVSKPSLDEKLQVQIDKLDIAEKNEIDALDKVEVKGKANTVKKKDMTINDVAVAVALNEFVEITNQDTGEVITLYSSDEGLRSDDEEGDLISIKDVKATFSQYSTYKLESKPDPKAVKEIQEKYNKLKEEVIAKYNAEKESGQAKVYSIHTPAKDLPEDLYKELQDSFNKSEQDAIDSIDEFDDEGMESLFSNFIQTNPLAKDIITAYNAKNTEEAEKEVSDEIDEFEFKQGDKVQQTAKLSTEGLIAIRDQIKLQRDKETEAAKKENYSRFINKLEKLINTRQRKGYTVDVQEKIKVLKEKLVAQQKNIEKKDETHYRVKSSGKLLERVTNFLKDFKTDTYEYIGTKAIKIAFNNTIDIQGLTEDSIDDFMNEIDATLTADGINSGYTKNTLDGIASTSDNIRNYLEELLENKAEIPIKSKRELLENIQNFISENAYEYTRKAGNYLDAQLRSFFTPGGKPVFDESEISREAFDEFFGPDSYISKLKQKIDSRELFVLANNIKVFDEETGVAGEIDLLLIDTEGKLQIIDFKTGDQKKWNGFVEQTKAGKNKTEDYTLQQYTYARILKKMTGLDAEINIMPLEITINQTEYKIASVKKPTNTELVGLNKWYFPLDPNFNGIKDTLDKEIKIKEQQTPSPTSNQSDIEAKKAEALNVAISINNIIQSKEVSKTIDDFTNTNLDREGKENLLQGDIKDIVDNWGIDEESVSDYMKQQGTTLVKTVWRKNKTEFFKLLESWKKGKDLKAELVALEELEPGIKVVTEVKLSDEDKTKLGRLGYKSEFYRKLSKEDLTKILQDSIPIDVFTKKQTTTEETLTTVEAQKADIERKVDEALNEIKEEFKEDVKRVFEKLTDPYKRYSYLKQKAKTISKNASIFDKHRDEDILKNPNSTLEEKVVAKFSVIRGGLSSPMGIFNSNKEEIISKQKFQGNSQDVKLLQELYNAELAALEEIAKTEKQATKVSQLDLKKGDTVIVEKTIPGRKNDPDFASAGAVITVMETTEKGVRFTYMGRQKSLSLTEMDKFVTTIPIQKAKDAEVADEKLDELDKELIADSIKVVKEFINSDTLIENAQGKANEKSLEDIYKDLLNDLDC